MKPINYLTKSVALAALATGLSLVQFEAKATFDHFEYSNLPGTQVTFTGAGGSAGIAFDNVGGLNFKITAVDPNAVPYTGAIGYAGLIGGTFTLGAGATTAPIVSVGGKITLYEGAAVGANYVTADLDWVEASNANFGFTSVGALGMTGNLSNVTLNGVVTDPALLAFAAGPDQYALLTYIFTPGKTLDDLRTAGSVEHTAYAGILRAIPEASDAGAVAGAAVLGLGIYAQIRRRRAAAKVAA